MFNKQDEKLLYELLKKYKQGSISGLVQGSNITLSPNGCRDRIISSKGGGSIDTFDCSDLSGCNISNLNNDSGYLVSSALNDYVPNTRNLTINGNTFDLSADRSWTVSSSIKMNEILSAIADNTIDNSNNKQSWSWNTLASGSGLTLSSTSTASVTNDAVLSVVKSGVAVTNTQTIYGLKVENTSQSGGGTIIGGLFSAQNASGNNIAIQTTGSGSNGYTALGVGNNGKIVWNNGDKDGSTIQNVSNVPELRITSPDVSAFGSVSLFTTKYGTKFYNKNTGALFANIGTFDNTKSYLLFGGDSYSTIYRSEFTTACLIERNLGVLKLSANAGLAGGYATLTPTFQLNVVGTTNNVGVGTETPTASAKLDVTSTTQGFLPPRMTTTQKNAIATPSEGLIVYDTDLKKLCVFTTVWETITSL